MSRVSGKVPSSSKFRVTPEHPHGYHGKFDPSVAGKPYVKRTGHHFDAIARPYKDGVVGSRGEIDYSVRSAYIPNGFILNLKEYQYDTFKRLRYENRPDPRAAWRAAGNKLITGMPYTTHGVNNVSTKHRPPKGFVLLVFQDDSTVVYWTKLAKSLGIEYHGERYYKFPKGMVGTLHAKSGIYYKSPSNPFLPRKGRQEFEFLKITGVISHRRSEFARIRRASRRAVSTVLKPLCISDVLTQRKCASARIRKLNFIKDETLYPAVNDKRGSCHQAPDIVVTAIKKLFSRAVKVDVIRPPGVTPFPEFPRTLRQTVYKPPHRRTLLLKKGTPVHVLDKGKMPLQASTIPFVGGDSDDVSKLSSDDESFWFTSSFRSKGKRIGHLSQDVRLAP